jgi:peptidoglycan/xylan/chitin deacetylase (PgdA/CDA1 family)
VLSTRVISSVLFNSRRTRTVCALPIQAWQFSAATQMGNWSDAPVSGDSSVEWQALLSRGASNSDSQAARLCSRSARMSIGRCVPLSRSSPPEQDVLPFSRVVAHQLSSAGSILCFHSVTDSRFPAAAPIHTPLPLLKAIVEGARRIAEVVPLPDLLQRHGSGRSTVGLLAITFDDAYAALSTVAGQFLSDVQVPVTVFAVSDALPRGSSFWWDRVEDLSVRVTDTRWRAFEDACALPAAFRRDKPPASGRFHPMRQFILSAHVGRWPQALDETLTELEEDAGYRAPHRSMNDEELRLLASHPWVHVGVHTRSHPVLPLLDDDEMADEISAGHRSLLDRYERVVPILAVPYGLFDRRTLAVAARLGMQNCMTLAGHPIRLSGDHGVPRICVDRRASAWRQLLRTVGWLDELRTSLRGTAQAFPPMPSATS